MRKYYDETNEEYERGYSAGRREALRCLDESNSKIFTVDEVNEILYKMSKKYKYFYPREKKNGFITLQSDFNSSGLYFFIERDRNKDGSHNLGIAGHFSSRGDVADLRVFNAYVNDAKRLSDMWKEIESMNITFTKDE